MWRHYTRCDVTTRDVTSLHGAVTSLHAAWCHFRWYRCAWTVAGTTDISDREVCWFSFRFRNVQLCSCFLVCWWSGAGPHARSSPWKDVAYGLCSHNKLLKYVISYRTIYRGAVVPYVISYRTIPILIKEQFRCSSFEHFYKEISIKNHINTTLVITVHRYDKSWIDDSDLWSKITR